MISDKFYAVVAGVGPATGRAVAIKFAKFYPVVLLSRHSDSYKDVVAEINKAGGKGIGVSADATDASSLAAAFETIKKELPGYKLAASIYNVRSGALSSLKPFLELNSDNLDSSVNSNVRGLFTFAQAVLPDLLGSVESSPHAPSILVTGATAAMRGSVKWAAIAPGKAGQRILAQSLAREFGPNGVHVAFAIIDGQIDIPDPSHYPTNEGTPDGKISPYGIAETFWFLHTQHKSAFTQEVDLRPFNEKF